MKLTKIALNNFRNFSLAETTLESGVNVFLGDNAQGKTNLLEAVNYLACGKSFRTRYERELIRFGQDEAEVRGISEARGRQFDIRIILSRGKRKKLL